MSHTHTHTLTRMSKSLGEEKIIPARGGMRLKNICRETWTPLITPISRASILPRQSVSQWATQTKLISTQVHITHKAQNKTETKLKQNTQHASAPLLKELRDCEVVEPQTHASDNHS